MPSRALTTLRLVAFTTTLLAAGAAVAQQCQWTPQQCANYAAQIRAYAASAGSAESIAVLQQMHNRYYSCGCR
jgi:hypothetical protein